MLIYLIIIGLVLYFLLRRSRKQTPRHSPTPVEPPTQIPEEEPEKEFSHSYQRKYIFSVYEKNEYRKLAAWAQKQGYSVFPKMRLADIIEPRHNGENYMSLFGRIKSKHVDFVVCDQECRIMFIIELDDNSHNQRNRVERDTFVGQACRGAGYTVLHTRAISEEFLNKLKPQELNRQQVVHPGTSGDIET